ncbi:AAA family ATPase [Thiorhodococcus minor]|uniref:AAA family ATPase n=1 Tax=Thiorhodococcus minor TaxID=57489 RepID=A0A6M0K6Z4_9GAMM|nr:AAA family ATPase [Thiorhodococcus minor]NEV65024.1 AAA family ATPase [Thiorhodococcus minor]
MFRLTELSTVGYRAFPGRLDLELRPLTLLYGRNNAGKSAVLRLLPILADSVADAATSPFDIGRVAGSGTSFLDVPARAGEAAPLKQVTLTLVWTDADEQRCHDAFILKYIDEANQTIVASYRCSSPVAVTCDMAAQPWPDHETYRVSVGGDGSGDQTIRPRFSGLVPAADSALPAALGGLRERLLRLRGQIQWLHSVRGRWPRLVTKTGRRFVLLDADGANAAEAVLTNPTVFDDVAAWYARPEIGRRLERIDAAVGQPIYRLLLNPSSGPLRDIDLLDTGEGMIQVLPVLVAAALARARGDAGILAVEEPESHLHANAQQALADHLCEIAAGASAPTIVVETHSRVLMLGVQLALAEGRLPPERVRAYWIDQESTGESIATPVDFDRHGRPLGGWPQAAFDEDQALARRLLDQQLQGGAFG